MSKRAQLPDGRVLEFPDATPDDVIDRTVRQELGVQRAADYPGMGRGARATANNVRRATTPAPAPAPRPSAAPPPRNPYSEQGAPAMTSAIPDALMPENMRGESGIDPYGEANQSLHDTFALNRVRAAADAQSDWVDKYQGLVSAIAAPALGPLATLGIIDSRLRQRSRTGEAQADFGQNDGMFDMAGQQLEAGVNDLISGLYREVSTALPDGGAREFLRSRARAGETVSNTEIAGDITGEDVFSDPLSNALPFIVNQGLRSLPTMAAAAIPYAGVPLVAASTAGQVAQGRAIADGETDASGAEGLVGALIGVPSALLERTGVEGILAPSGTSAARRFGTSVATETATEGLQNPLEYAGSTVGTEQGFDPATAVDQALLGALAGGGMGAGGHVAVHGGQGAVRLGAELLQRRADARAETEANLWTDQVNAMAAFDPNNGVPLTPSAGAGVASRPPAASPPAARVPLTPVAPEAATPQPTNAAPEPAEQAPPWTPIQNDSDGYLLDEQGARRLTFATQREAARHQAANGLGGTYDIAVDGNRFSLRINATVRDNGLRNRLDAERAERAKRAAAEPAAAPAPIPLPEPQQTGVAEPVTPAPSPAPNARRVYTPTGDQIDVTNEIIDASQLRFAEGVMQNRDRDRAASEAQIMGIVGDFKPEWLGDDNYSDRGAPIVGPDGTILSGNGRTMAINRIYDERPELADRYRQYLTEQGYNIEGIERPVLVRRAGEMTPEQMRSFVTGSNVDNKLQMSRPELAAQDATDVLTPDVMSRYMGGALNSQRNGAFVQSFIAALPQSQRGNFMDESGGLSVDGVARIENAMLARAFNNGTPTAKRFLSRAMEQTDNQTRTLTGALAEVAPAWGEMTQAMKDGKVDPQYDLTDKLLEAIALIADTKGDGESVRNVLESDDMFNALDPTVEKLMRAFHNPNLRRMKSKQKIADMLERYARLAMEQRPTPDMFGEVVLRDPKDVLDDAIGANDQGDLLAAEERIPANDTEPEGEGAPRRNRRQPEAAEERPGDGRGSGARSQGVQGEGSQGRRDGRGRVARSGVTGEDKGDYQTTFMEAAYTNRPSVYDGAIRATGVDPARFRNLPPERRLKLLKDVFTDLTGMPVKVKEGMNLNIAIDQLIDAFTTLQGMAYMLGVSPRALSLQGTLKLELVGKAHFLGAYYPGEARIALPGRSNSFAHEWAHALDYDMLRRLTDKDGKGLTGATRAEGADFAPRNVRTAFIDLLNAMFFDEKEMAAKIMKLEAQIAATTSAKRKAELQAQIDRFAKGSSQSRTGRSRFYKAAQTMDGKSGDYWTSPTELFARAFEAYVADQAAKEGLGTEFISKNDQQYRSDSEVDFELRYPKLEERLRIFEAIGELMHQIAREQVLKDPGQRADTAPDAGQLRRLTDFDRRVEHVENGGLLKRQLNEIERWARERGRRDVGRAKDPKSALKRLQDVASITVYSMAGKLKMIEARYKSPEVGKIHDLVAWTPGEGNRRVGPTFTEEVEKFRTQNWNRMANILKQHDLVKMSDEQERQLRDALLGAPAEGTPKNITEAAGGLRQLMDGEHYRATNSGIKLGYARGVGYLQRALDVPLVMGNQPRFVEQAAKVYEVVFDRDIGDSVDAIFENETYGEFKKAAKAAGIDLKAITAIDKKIKALESQQAKSDDPDAIAAKLEKLYEERSEALAEAFDAVRSAYADTKANAWMHKILSAADIDFDASSPDSSFTKRRELPPEADKLMEEFYTQNPVEAIQNYFGQSARRIAYARRFGVDGSKRKAMLDQMAREGVSAEDQVEVMKVVDIATGRINNDTSRSAQRLLSFIHAYGTMRLLPRAVWSSIAEPFTAGFAGGKGGVSGFRAMAGTLNGWTPNGKQRQELAQAIGIIGDAIGDHILSERFGGVYGGVTRFDQIVNRMFVNTGLHALTRAQRAGTIAASHAMLMHSAKGALDGDKEARAFLTELGVRDVDAFSQELIDKGRMPTVEELDSAWGEDYGLATSRFVNMTIQNPDPMSRPQLANSPVGRVLYGILSFSMSFWRNVTKRQMIITKQTYERSGVMRALGHVGASTLPAALLLLLFNGAISTLREWLLNRDRWEEMERDGKLEETMLGIAFFRTFSFGIAEPIVQAVSGLKYQRDLANVFIGPSPGIMLQDLGTVISSYQRNSDTTNTTEYNRTRAIYNAVVAPALSMGLSYLPGGPLLSPAAGAAQMYVTSPAAGNRVATAIEGPKGTKTDPETGELLETPEEVEARLEAKRQRRIERERKAGES